ncbi:inosine-uridine preferring nucleoside hydrolase-like [Dermacentor silvarum]|uniref:inosine-uridine preferring nucleoside hydrolase-like n=1 Tax=Dermacentor silvarum TaxID=543639 RepID=UPI00210129DF|nr:inosine-uridine preferring nucleoside hydrolase-like [Dermacentor silvarum]
MDVPLEARATLEEENERVCLSVCHGLIAVPFLTSPVRDVKLQLGGNGLDMMSSSDPEFKKLQREMMARYPHHVRGDVTSSQSSEMLYGVDPTTYDEQSFGESQDEMRRAPVVVSSSQMLAESPRASRSQHHEVPREPRPSHQRNADRLNYKARVRRKREKESRHSREIARDCLLIVLLITLIVLLILFLASHDFFGGGEKTVDTVPKTPKPIPKGGPLRLIVDVDTGVDDAMALTFALTSERATVDAITVVAGNAYLDVAYNNTLRVLKVLDMPEVPVYKGADRPISGLWKTEKEYFGPDNFGGVSAKYPMAVLQSESKKLAHVAMRDMIRQRPKELTLVALGPLTNLAIAMLMDPGLTDDIAQIFVLGGNIYGKGNVKPAAEFNFITDPEAARVVLQRATCPVTIVVWEAMLQAAVPLHVYKDVVAEDTKLARFLRDVSNHTVECCLEHTSRSFLLGDFLAVLAALVPDSVNGSMESRSDVELHGDYTRGQMVHAWLQNHLPHITHSVTVVHSFDTDAVTDHFRKVFLAEDNGDDE